jgi:hypothetical protein
MRRPIFKGSECAAGGKNKKEQKKEKPMTPRKKALFKREAKGKRRQESFEKEGRRGMQNEISMTI